MIQFNIHRFGKVAKRSLTNDKKYHWKSFLQTLVILMLVFLFFTTSQNRIMVGQISYSYQACCIATLVSFVVTIVLGPSFMFYSMDGKHDMQALMMLPASNFEKYLMRYASWIILLPIHLVAFFAADLVQYIVNMLMGHDYTTFVTTCLVDVVIDTWHKIPAGLHVPIAVSAIFSIVWLHSCYALGATFFRSNKYNWVATTIVIILITIVQLAIFPEGKELINRMPSIMEVIVTLVWVILNFWLSYRLFCRQQVIGKFINV